MYFPWNWEFGSALSKLRNFGGRGLNPPTPLPLGTPLRYNNSLIMPAIQRIRWLGHVRRMEVGAVPRKMKEGRLLTGRRKGRPRVRWTDDVVADLRVMEIKLWTEKTKDREQWSPVVEEAKARPGL
jgi:hypothetical protein